MAMPAFVWLVVGSPRRGRCDVSLPVGIVNPPPFQSVTGHCAAIGRSAVEGARIVSLHAFVVISLIFVDQGHPINTERSAVVYFLEGGYPRLGTLHLRCRLSCPAEVVCAFVWRDVVEDTEEPILSCFNSSFHRAPHQKVDHRRPRARRSGYAF